MEKARELLINLGLSWNNAKVFLLVARNGPMNAKDIAASLHLEKWQVYRSMRHLKKDGIAIISANYPALLSAVSFEQAIEILSKPKHKCIYELEKNRKEILSKWQSVTTDKLQT